jgi:hypothetical protein
MIDQHDAEVSAPAQIGECQGSPKSIQLDVISRFDRDVLFALLHRDAC